MKRISELFGMLSGICGLFVIGSLAVVAFPRVFLTSTQQVERLDLVATIQVLGAISLLSGLFFFLWLIFDAREESARRVEKLKQRTGCPVTEAALKRADKVRSEESLRRHMAERGVL